MATYTQDQINAAYATERGNGASDADLSRIATGLGISGDQFSQAASSYTPTPAPTPAGGGGIISSAVAGPAPASSGWEGGRDLTADEISASKQWSVGKTSQEAAQQAAGMGLTQKQLGQIYGWTPEDSAIGGYGTSAGLDKARYDYTYDAQKGWTKEGKKPNGTGFSTASVTPWTVDRNQTVQGQAYDVIDKDSPLMQQARARALQQMNERGLVNSSFAVQAGQDAVMDRALQIATPDAATYANSAQFNANANNTSSMFNAGQSNQYDLASRELAQKQSQFDTTTAQKDTQFNQTMSQADRQFADNLKLQYKQLDTNKEVSMANGQNSLAAAGISASTQRDIAMLNNDFRVSGAKTDSFNTRYDNFITKVTNITMDKDLSSDAKNNMINSEVNVIKGWASMNGIVGDLSYLDAYASGSKTGGVNAPASAPAPATITAGDTGGD